MDIASVIVKAADGESLSEEERAVLRAFPAQDRIFFRFIYHSTIKIKIIN